MNIVMLAQEYPPYLLGGTATHVQELSRGLVSAGHSVHVFSFSTERTFTMDDQGVCVHFLHFPFQGREHQYDGRLHEVEGLNQMLAEHAKQAFRDSRPPDIVHAHEWIEFECGRRLSACFNTRLVVTSHMVWAHLLETMMPHPEWERIIELEAESCRQANRVIAVSRSLKEQIITRYGVAGSQVDVVFNGFDTRIFNPETLSTDLIRAERERLGPGNDKLIVYAGRLSPQKGLSALFRSAIQILRQRDDVRYIIAGKLEPGGYSDLLVKMVRGHPKLSSKTTFLDQVSRERLAALYALATLVVVPSIYEPFGYAALEPMAAGKPVVASNTGGLAEIIEDEKSGLLVPLARAGNTTVCDVDMPRLVDAQNRILDDRGIARRLGEGARERVRSHFSLQQMIDGTLGTYKSVLAVESQPAQMIG